MMADTQPQGTNILGIITGILQIANASAPEISSLILMIRDKNGNVSMGTYLDQADKNFDTNIAQASDWLAAHPQKG